MDDNYSNRSLFPANLVPFILEVRLWDYASGSLLDTCELGTKVGWQFKLPFLCLYLYYYL